ncbi:MAG: hypothetical protein A3H96_19815 [Acidobacteria bacterium RIFCSPLOWO2_02_FULL_67_36]|nr:MAG: hypothetical protein A3H96_19815 [Acidobacteria bacterium RIFCSPLOWO2_02_FULL_67_36]OFW23717.1 MAG: hypothetical protein A3G21_20250 [Acidobacteria bacterium RIFCSPLOWO2_12_FULL_66_21]
MDPTARTRRPWVSLVLSACPCVLTMAIADAAVAQGPEARPVARAVAVADAPRVDGRLDDTVWASAAVVGDFRQKEPAEGRPATESTRVRIVYGKTHLYIAAELDDREPALIRATELRRDNALVSDDSFAVLLDTYHDRRNAFIFRVNPLGTRFDAVVRNESPVVDAEWDEEWSAASVIGERGWTIEMAIPFKILRFSLGDVQVWGLNFERVIKRKNEFDYWTSWHRNFAFTAVSQAGQLTDLKGIRQAERLRIRPYVATGVEKLDAVSSPDPTHGLREVGIDDLKFTVTSNLTADLTINPDFAQVEVDDQRVNLTRYSLFFPERRQFFIEGSDSLKMGIQTLGFGSRLLELVYTRTMGLSPTGQPIRILGGGKLTGKAAGFDVGLLNVQTGDSDGSAGENFAVARIRKEMLDRSYVGAIVTNREGGDTSNHVVGADARFVLRKYFSVVGMAAASSDAQVPGTKSATQVGAEWLSDFVQADVNFASIDEGFTPGAGYVRRHDRMLGAKFSLKPRPGGRLVRQFEITPNALVYQNRRGVAQTSVSGVSFVSLFQSGDRMSGKVEFESERLPEPLEIFQGIVLPAGYYTWKQVEVNFDTFNGRKFSGRAEANLGQFYSGRQGAYEFGLQYRPGKNFSVESSYDFNDIDLREGSFHTHLLGVKTNVSFTNSLLASAYAQYNNTGNLAALQLRLNYIFRTIDNFYLVYNDTQYTAGVYKNRSNRSLVAKLTYSVSR